MLNPQMRFLARGSMLVALMLALWWWILADPLLSALRFSADFAMRFLMDAESPISIADSGDWNFRVPMEFEMPGKVKSHSIEFTASRADILAFTFSLPVYWALAMAAPRRRFKSVLVGTAIIGVIEIVSLLVFAEVTAQTAALQWRPAPSAVAIYLRMVATYLVVNVIPYASPFLVLLGVDRELRAKIFSLPELREESAIVRSSTRVAPGVRR